MLCEALLSFTRFKPVYFLLFPLITPQELVNNSSVLSWGIAFPMGTLIPPFSPNKTAPSLPGSPHQAVVPPLHGLGCPPLDVPLCPWQTGQRPELHTVLWQGCTNTLCNSKMTSAKSLVLNTLPYDAQHCWCSGCPHTVSWWFQRTVSCDSDPSWAAAVGSEHCDVSGTDRSRGAWTGKQFVTDGAFRSASDSFEPGEVPISSHTYFRSAKFSPVKGLFFISRHATCYFCKGNNL